MGIDLEGFTHQPCLLRQGHRPCGDVAYPGVKKVGLIRDPLEWLTLGELLALRAEKKQVGDLGLDALTWRRLEVDVMPIRNQISHMRLTKPGDISTLKNWDAVLKRRLNT